MSTPPSIRRMLARAFTPPVGVPTVAADSQAAPQPATAPELPAALPVLRPAVTEVPPTLPPFATRAPVSGEDRSEDRPGPSRVEVWPVAEDPLPVMPEPTAAVAGVAPPCAAHHQHTASTEGPTEGPTEGFTTASAPGRAPTSAPADTSPLQVSAASPHAVGPAVAAEPVRPAFPDDQAPVLTAPAPGLLTTWPEPQARPRQEPQPAPPRPEPVVPVQIGRIEVQVAGSPPAPDPFAGLREVADGLTTRRGGGW